MITVVIPTYNRASFLREALQSVFAQTLKPMEVIVVDDGSTDETLEMCEKEFPWVRYYYQENRGVSAARNVGIKASRGDWIALLDSDDAWVPEKLEEQWQFVQENQEAKIVQTEEIWIRKGKRVNPKKIHQKKSGWIFEDCIPLCIISPSAVMIHKDVINKIGLFDEELGTCEDYDLWLRISLHYPIYLLEKSLIIKRNGHMGQLSATHGQDANRVQALLKILKDPEMNVTQTDLVKKDIIRRSKILAQGCLKREKLEEAKYYQSIPSQLS